VAAILDIDEFEDWLEMKDPKIKEQIRRGYEEYKKGKTVTLDKFLSKIQWTTPPQAAGYQKL